MMIGQKNPIQNNNMYWYVHLDRSCYWKVEAYPKDNKHGWVYDGKTSPADLDNMIIFDNEAEAQACANAIQKFVDRFLYKNN